MTAAPVRGRDRALLRDRPTAKTSTTKRATVLKPAELAAMIGAATPFYRALLSLMTAGACRVGEATLLTWYDISPEGMVTIVGGTTKTGVGRSFTLPPAALVHVEAWRALCPVSARGWVFPGRPVRNPLGTRAAMAAITKLAEGLGLKGISSHSFRRSALTIAHAEGRSLREVAVISGHQSLAALEKYLDQDAARVKAEAARGLMFAAMEG